MRFGIHSTGEQLGDPTWRNPSGQPYVDAEYMRANIAAEQKVLDELNVKIQWVTGYDRSWNTIEDRLNTFRQVVGE